MAGVGTPEVSSSAIILIYTLAFILPGRQTPVLVLLPSLRTLLFLNSLPFSSPSLPNSSLPAPLLSSLFFSFHHDWFKENQ